jgi:hypothetical protein
VFFTGGSPPEPAVRRIFEARLGEQRIRTGNEFISVARGSLACVEAYGLQPVHSLRARTGFSP